MGNLLSKEIRVSGVFCLCRDDALVPVFLSWCSSERESPQGLCTKTLCLLGRRGAFPGAQDAALANCDAIQMTSVVLNTMFPRMESACPLQRRAKSRLIRKMDVTRVEGGTDRGALSKPVVALEIASGP